MLWASYGRISKDGLNGMLQNPHNRAEAIGKLIQAYGPRPQRIFCVSSQPCEWQAGVHLPSGIPNPMA